MGHQEDALKLRELNQLEALTASAYKTIDICLSVPDAILMHLPSSTFATIWYALLCLSKLSSFFHPNEHEAIRLNINTIHSRGAAIARRFEEISIGDDVWTSSKKVIENMLAWLQRMNTKAQKNYLPQKAHSPGSVTASGNALQSLPLDGRNSDSRLFEPPADFPEHVATTDVEDLPYEIDATMWQQMLDIFNLPDSVRENVPEEI